MLAKYNPRAQSDPLPVLEIKFYWNRALFFYILSFALQEQN